VLLLEQTWLKDVSHAQRRLMFGGLTDEDVVVDTVSDGAANDSDGESECSNGCNKVIRADDCG
jgi:hypothetical protein